ncbi:MAG: protein-glutamate O-methyltransferase CheR [Treponema sp.]|nr:protein-glutamate O-methyltransferase CheR [Treponema sp.]
MTVNEENLGMIIDIITATTGIIPRSSHREGIRSYLSAKMDELGIASVKEYTDKLKKDRTLFMELVNESTVNETYFFREEKQFTFVRSKILPNWIARHGSQPIKMWSAACSYGEEAYSLALLARDCGARAHITASDINTAVLSHCAEGVFNASSMRGGDGVAFQNLLLPYRTADAKIAFSDELRGYITTRQINLAEMDNPASEGILPKMQDIVFIRNVFIYFSQDLRARILKTIADRCMAEDGILFVSMSEIAQIDGSVMPVSLEKVSDGSVFYFQKKRTEG